jgi:hypothetical protein
VERQAIESLLELYREAMIEEDIDRLQALLQPVPALAQAVSEVGSDGGNHYIYFVCNIPVHWREPEQPTPILCPPLEMMRIAG